MANTGFVLLVDDEPDFLTTMTFWLESHGHTVKTATNGVEALQSIQKETPSIVFLDINMPDMSGIEVLKKLRDKNKTLPVIMLTAAVNHTLIKEASQLGVSGFFPKEESLEKLSRLIDASVRIQKNLN